MTISGGGQGEGSHCDGSRPVYVAPTFGGLPFACNEILGKTLLQRLLDSLDHFGVQQKAVLFEETGTGSLFPSRAPAAGGFFAAWEHRVRQQVALGAELLILIRMGAYLELDLTDLIQFHEQTSSVLTQVYDNRSALEVAVVSAEHLRGDKGSYRGRLGALIPYHRRYNFTGYSNRLREAQDFRELAQDALFGRNSIQPVGKEIRSGVWVGQGAKIDSEAKIAGPVFIGAHTNIKGSCLINGASNIERDCEVDFGTSVTNSSVLPGTRIGIGLNVMNAIVASNKLLSLDRNVEVEISDRALLGKQRSIRTFAKLIAEKDFFNRGDRQPNGIESHL